MTTSAKPHRAASVDVGEGMLGVTLDDGRKLSVPLSWFPRLDRAAEEELQSWELIGSGLGIHWPRIDEHGSVHSLLHPEHTIPSREIRERRDQED